MIIRLLFIRNDHPISTIFKPLERLFTDHGACYRYFSLYWYFYFLFLNHIFIT